MYLRIYAQATYMHISMILLYTHSRAEYKQLRASRKYATTKHKVSYIRTYIHVHIAAYVVCHTYVGTT